MIDFAALATVVLVYAAGVIIPGPNFVLVVRQAAAGSRARAGDRRRHCRCLRAGAALFGLVVAFNACLPAGADSA
jgi:threonine/homoserine/homoserine lactone efflux protein